MKIKLSIQNVYKIFGKQPKKAMALLEQGTTKDKIFSDTGQTVGVKDASFDVYEGEIFVIMGLSGSGKSTMVRMLNRLIEPTQGKIFLDDTDIASLDAKALRQVRLHKISMVFQSFALMPHLNVRDNTAFGLDLAGDVSIEERTSRADAALDRVGLLANADSLPSELSGGMQQRVGLARALCINPDVLLMDEAFSALDPLIRSEMQDELLRLQAEDKRTIVFISHDLDEAVRIGDRIAIMQDGEVVQVGTPDDIINDPANDYVRSFFRGVDVSQVLSAKDVASGKHQTLIKKTSATSINTSLQLLNDNGRNFGYVVDARNQFIAMVSTDSLKQAEQKNQTLEHAFLSSPQTIMANTPLGNLISNVAHAPYAPPVINEQGEFLGVISKTVLLETLGRKTGDAL